MIKIHLPDSGLGPLAFVKNGITITFQPWRSEAHVTVVGKAIEKIQGVAGSDTCNSYFTELPGGLELGALLAQREIWVSHSLGEWQAEIIREGKKLKSKVYAAHASGHDRITLTDGCLRMAMYGIEYVASFLVHELAHANGVPWIYPDHLLADFAPVACGLPDRYEMEGLPSAREIWNGIKSTSYGALCPACGELIR